jgi:uroporphyrinogen-III decarboxylase
MSIRERILEVYQNKLPDKIPTAIYSRYLRSGQNERFARNSGLGILSFTPVISLLAPPWHLHPGYISEVKNVSFDVSFKWFGNDLIQERKFETPVGSLSALIGKDPGYGSDWVKKHYIEDTEDYRIMQYIVENTILRPQENLIVQAKKDLGEDGVVLGRMDRAPYQKLLTELANPTKFLMDLYDNPGPVNELIQTMDARLDEQFNMAMESSVDVIWSPDNVTADMTPPPQFEQFMLPYYKKHGVQCKDAEKIYAVHMDGRTNSIKQLIAASPFDVIDSFSFAEMSGDVPVSEAKAIWPDKVICPNFPASICEKSKKEIENYLQGVIEDFGIEAPFMIMISEDIPLSSYDHVLPVLTSYMDAHGKV